MQVNQSHIYPSLSAGRVVKRAAWCVRASSTVSPSPSVTTPALKEWTAVCSAIGNGDQTILFRKGGLRELEFSIQAERFWLFPTCFHLKSRSLKDWAIEKYSQDLTLDPKAQPKLCLRILAEMTGCWTSSSSGIVEALSEHHIWGPDFAEQRLGWRHKQPVTIVELRAKVAQSPLVLPSLADYWGCFSWVDLQEDAPSIESAWSRAAPALTADQFASLQQKLRQRLTEMPGVQPLLPHL